MATSMTAAAGVRYKRARNFREEFIMEVNDKAPDFSVPDQDGKPVSLKDFRGKPVVLFFFPKADTPG
jgi:cytochrome oxidase Cu insertion factor (SCO1/SenC/PrrC family)